MSVEDAITHSPRSEMSIRSCSVCALTALGPGTTRQPEYRNMYIYTQSRCGSDPFLSTRASSDLQPAILELWVRDAESAASGQTFPARCRLFQPDYHEPVREAAETLSIHLKLYFKLYSTHTVAALGLAYPSCGYFRRTKYDCAV